MIVRNVSKTLSIRSITYLSTSLGSYDCSQHTIVVSKNVHSSLTKIIFKKVPLVQTGFSVKRGIHITRRTARLCSRSYARSLFVKEWLVLSTYSNIMWV